MSDLADLERRVEALEKVIGQMAAAAKNAQEEDLGGGGNA